MITEIHSTIPSGKQIKVTSSNLRLAWFDRSFAETRTELDGKGSYENLLTRLDAIKKRCEAEFSRSPLTNRFIKSRTMAIVFLASPCARTSFPYEGVARMRERDRVANEQDTRRQASLIFHKSVCETCSSGGAYVCITDINIQTRKLELSYPGNSGNRDRRPHSTSVASVTLATFIPLEDCPLAACQGGILHVM